MVGFGNGRNIYVWLCVDVKSISKGNQRDRLRDKECIGLFDSVERSASRSH